MCGITGYFSPHRQESSSDKIVNMTQLIRHRGPDDEGYVFIDVHSNIFTNAYGEDSQDSIKSQLRDVMSIDINHNISFGHRRYAIIDLTSGGHQPFWDKDNLICVSFNGEIYNYIELRYELEKKGYKFNTTSDTEVLINAYVEWGDNCFERFNGTWALSLYDANKHMLLLSRDRIGKNPLYYTIIDDILYWSSEIKSLLSVCGDNVFSINKQAIYDFIKYGIRDLDNSTFWNEIHTLPAASYVWIDDSLNFQEYIYWKIPTKRLQTNEITLEHAKDQLRSLLTDALKIRLRSDIAVGFALSGGMDSSSLIAIYAGILKKNAVSFTVKFPQKGSNEEPFASKVAKRYENFIDYRVIEPLFSEFWMVADNYVWLIEEPFHSPNVYIEQMLQKRLKSEGFGVMINGNGGDEILAGYEHLYYSPYLDYLFHNRKLSFIIESVSWINKDFNAFIRTLRAVLSLAPNVKGFIKRFMCKENSFLQNMGCVKRRHIPNNFNDIMIGNMGQWLMNYWLRVGNKSYFAVPMETRSPFLDYRLVEFAFRLPPEYLIHNGWQKYILRKAMDDLLPKEIIWRKNKMGFPFPFHEWLDYSKPIVENNLKDIDCPYIDVKSLLGKYDHMVKKNPVLLWRYISVLLWWKRVILKEQLDTYIK